ncbi:MAG TPA: hypothetical protein VLM85_13390 [Polyangiaceae bacterium]|nr:hypothetical protein [Polyangiaceae bacterium]
MGSYGCSSSPAKTDGGTDAKADTSTKPDTGTTGDGGGCTSGLACELCDVSGFTPTTQSAPTQMANACTQTQINDFVTACFGSGTSTTCSAWQSANADAGSCVSCVFTLQSAAAWGALVCTSSGCSLNSPGCLDLELSQVSQEKQAGGAGSCGDVLSASYGCQDYACGTCTTTGGTSSDFSTCVNAALNAECKSYGDKFTTDPACASLQGDAAPAGALKCFPQADTDVPAFVNVFCGTGL